MTGPYPKTFSPANVKKDQDFYASDIEFSIAATHECMVGADTDRQAIEDTSWSNGAFTHSLVNGLNGAADGFQSIVAPKMVLSQWESFVLT